MTIFWGTFMTLYSFLLHYCAAEEPCTEAVGESTLYCAAVKGYQQSLRDVVVPENSQEVEALVGLLH